MLFTNIVKTIVGLGFRALFPGSVHLLLAFYIHKKRQTTLINSVQWMSFSMTFHDPKLNSMNFRARKIIIIKFLDFPGWQEQTLKYMVNKGLIMNTTKLHVSNKIICTTRYMKCLQKCSKKFNCWGIKNV